LVNQTRRNEAKEWLMKDKLLEGYLKDFVESHKFNDLPMSEAFEHFVNRCIVAREHPENIEFESMKVGGSGDLAIDGIGILVNEHLVSSVEDVNFFLRTLRRLDVRFLFVQSKTSENFNLAEIGSFFYGVQSFFKKEPVNSMNARLREFRELKDYIYTKTIDMERAPTCELFYVTCGKWTGDQALKDRIHAGKMDLDATGLFSEVLFNPIDAEGLKTLYRELRRMVVREIVFDKHTILPGIDHVQEAYIGILPCTEYMKLICDSEGNLQRSLFYDNVRDFQGNNPVNMEVQATLNQTDQRDKFVLLNNGITIVAQSINKVGPNFKLMDFQIVNGCQTSHILYRCRDRLAGAFLPVKIIVTADADVTNAITKGTNRQTEVKIEAFESLNPFQKELEEFYSTFGKEHEPRLYYERRSKQYETLPINREHVVTLPAQVKCFVGMFLNDPHSTHRYYGELLEANRSRIFLPNHSAFPYYLSGYALVRCERWLTQRNVNRITRQFKYHFLMLSRFLASKNATPYLDDKKKMDVYCSDLLAILSDETKSDKVFSDAQQLLERELKKGLYERYEAHRLKAFTSGLIDIAGEGRNTGLATVSRADGHVKWFSDLRGYGFIESGGQDFFVHFRDIVGTGYRTLEPGQLVEFTVIRGPKGSQAVGVQPLEGPASR
jgi:cold shock CspA family protein